MEKQKRIPKRRFREFLEAGEWEEKTVKEVAPLQRGFDLPINLMKDGNYPVIASNGIIGYHNQYKAKGPGVVTGRSGTIGNLHYVEKDYWPHNTSLWVTDFKGNWAEFVYYLYTKLDLSKFGTGSGVPTLNRNDVHDTYVFAPSLPEQQHVSNFCRRLDTLISLHQQKLSKLKDLKQAYLTEMFPAPGEKRPRRRFKGFSGDWEEKRLGDITESYSGGTPSVDVKKFYGGDIPFIRSAEINSDSTELYLTKDGFNSSSAKMVEKGCILYALYGATSGETGLSKIKGAINQAILAIIPHDGYDASFIMQWLRLNKGKIIETYLQGGQGNLSGNIVKDLVLDIPEYEEQKIIGKFVCNLDCLIEKAENRISKLQSLKQAYLSELFV